MPGTAPPSGIICDLRLALGIAALCVGLMVTFAGLRTPDRPPPASKDLDEWPAVSAARLEYGGSFGEAMRFGMLPSPCDCVASRHTSFVVATTAAEQQPRERFAGEGAGGRDMVMMYSSARAFLDMNSQLQHHRPRSSIAEVWQHRYGVAYTTGRGSPLEAQTKREFVPTSNS